MIRSFSIKCIAHLLYIIQPFFYYPSQDQEKSFFPSFFRDVAVMHISKLLCILEWLICEVGGVTSIYLRGDQGNSHLLCDALLDLIMWCVFWLGLLIVTRPEFFQEIEKAISIHAEIILWLSSTLTVAFILFTSIWHPVFLCFFFFFNAVKKQTDF